MACDDFDVLWRTMTQALREPVLLSVPETISETRTGASASKATADTALDPGAVERFHAWFDPGGDDKPEVIWTKPLQGKKQVRLSHRRDDFRRVYEAVTQGTHAPSQLRDLVLRGHYLYTLMRHHGWTPTSSR